MYEVIIKNEPDIPETEKGDYCDGITITEITIKNPCHVHERTSVMLRYKSPEN